MSDNSTQNQANSASSSSSNDNANRTARGGWDAVSQHIANHKIDMILAITRALTILCSLAFLVGIFGQPENRYKQALLMTAATSSLRLHQRMPPPPLRLMNLSYLSNLIKEDSFHYLMFPFLFFFERPLTLTLLPCSLYAIFNLAVYAITLLDKYGGHDQLKMQISNLIAKYQQSLLHAIALSELALMALVSIGFKSVRFLVIIFYYRFLLLRYNSTRNAHLRTLVAQVKTIGQSYLGRYTRV